MSARRPAQAHRFEVPDRDQVLYWLKRMQAGDVSQEAAAEWAGEYIAFDDPDVYPAIRDRAVWDALNDISRAARREGDRYRYDARDFESWARRLASAPDQ